jgi:hypothetical protein
VEKIMNTFESDRWESRLTEAFDTLWDLFVDPREAYLDDGGVMWNSLAMHASSSPKSSVPFATEEELAEIRRQVRHLVNTNEFAINGIENRVSYLVGTGHVYRACVRKGIDAPAELEAEVQAVIDEFLLVNRWQSRSKKSCGGWIATAKSSCGYSPTPRE